MKKIVWICLLFLVVFSGCGTQQKPTKPKPEGKAAAKFAVVPKAITGEYWANFEKGVRKAEKELGVEVIYDGPPSETDIDKQISLIENLIAKQVAGIAISPTDGTALAPVIEKAMEAGIPVLTVDSDAKTDKKLCYIGTNNVAAGKKAGETMSKLLGGKGKVAILVGVPGAQNLLQRIDGFKEALKKFPGIKIVSEQADNVDKATAMSLSENVLTAHPDLAGFYAVTNQAGTGAAEAIAAAGKTGKVKVVTFDLTPEGISTLKKGTVTAIMEQKPVLMGYLGVKTLVEAKSGTQPEEKVIDTGVDVVTKESLEKYVK